MSDINGIGHGSTHDWKDMGTEQQLIPQERSTLYICKICNARFRHYYHVIPDIFEAMKIRNIPEKCIKEDKNDSER